MLVKSPKSSSLEFNRQVTKTRKFAKKIGNYPSSPKVPLEGSPKQQSAIRFLANAVGLSGLAVKNLKGYCH